MIEESLSGNFSTPRPKLYVWRVWQSPTMRLLLDEIGPLVGVEEAKQLFTLNGDKVRDEEDILNGGTYYVLGEEGFMR